MKLQKIKAFTLVELIVVIVILSILATIGFMSYESYTSDARDSNRITSLKTIQSSLNIYKTKNQTLPFPDNYVDITGVSYQGNIGTGIINKLKLSGTFKDPKDSNYYTYSVSKNLSKFQISSLLENNNKIIFSFDDNLLNQVYADNTSRYTYTLGDRIGILLDSTTNTPVNELLNGTGTLNLNTDNNTYKAVFTNDTTNSGTIIGSGTNLRTEISIVQNSCVLGSSVITSGQQINAYNTNSVAYNQTCTPIIRSCNNGVLDGDTNYKYDTCSPSTALNCTATTYNGYDIPAINHNNTQNVTKNITGGVADITASCLNGVLIYGTENINCSANYVLDGGICKQDICTGSAPDFSISNGTQKYNNPWLHNTTAGICTYICQAGYYYNTNLCNAASIGYVVSTEGQTNQTACNANDKYQDTTGQTSCKNVSAGYYSTPIGNVAHTGQTQCEANNYCIGGVKYACSAGYSSPVGSSSAGDCVINQYTVNGTITNGNGATVNICGKTTTADSSGNFSVTANYGTNCNNLSITRTNYTCSVSTNGSSSITSNSSASGTCTPNTQTYTCTGLPTNAIWNTVSSYIQTRNGSAWNPVNSTTSYNTSASTTSCNFKCNTNYHRESSSCKSDTQVIAITDGTCNQTWNGTSRNSCTSGTCTNGATWNSTYGCAIAVNGVCGSSNGVATRTAPSTNLCTTGTASSVTNNTYTYTWSCGGSNGGANSNCSASKQQTYICTGLPSNATWNTVSSYIQTRNGSAWNPVNSTATYNTTASTTSCNYKCNTSYHLETSSCLSNTRSCTITNGAGNQTWNGSSRNSCIPSTCNSGYTLDGNGCYKVACITGTYNSSTNKCDSSSNYSCNYVATANSTTTCSPQSCEYYLGGGDGGVQYDEYGNPIAGGSNQCCNGGSCVPAGDICTTNTTYSCPSGGSISGTTCLKTCTSITSTSAVCSSPTLNSGVRKCY